MAGEINKTKKKEKEMKKEKRQEKPEAFGVPSLPPGLMRSV